MLVSELAKQMDEFESFVTSVTAQLKSQLRGSQPHETAWNQLQAFLHAVDWRERWLTALLCFHAAMAVAALLTRRSDGAQAALFVFVCALTQRDIHHSEAHAPQWCWYTRQSS